MGGVPSNNDKPSDDGAHRMWFNLKLTLIALLGALIVRYALFPDANEARAFADHANRYILFVLGPLLLATLASVILTLGMEEHKQRSAMSVLKRINIAVSVVIGVGWLVGFKMGLLG